MPRGMMVALVVAAALAQTQDVPKAAAGTRTREGASDKPTDCSMVEALLGNEVLAVRTYEEPPRTRATGNWERPPYMKAIARCGHLYIFQVSSRSREPWVVKQARVEGPSGEMLRVNALFNKARRDRWSDNVIVAEKPPGVMLTQLELTLASADGRAAQIAVKDLP